MQDGERDLNRAGSEAAGLPIPGLYLAGNDLHSFMGGEYPAPGTTLGPAMAFGRVAGRHLSQPNPAAP